MDPNSQLISEKELSLCDIYSLALQFIHENKGKASLNLSYDDNNYLGALNLQISNGPELSSKVPPPGFLDVVGRERRLAWKRLSNISGNECRSRFIKLVKDKCHLFETYLEAHKMKKYCNLNPVQIEESRRLAEQVHLEKIQHKEDEIFNKQIKQCINRKTLSQFRKYSEQNYPDDAEKQANLIRELQDQHYVQYMQQLHSQTNPELKLEADVQCVMDEVDSLLHNLELKPAKLWVKSNVDNFKKAVKHDMSDNVVLIGQGEAVTIRVPTHKNGSKLYWEFTTDNYDLGFGLFFEPGIPQDDKLSIHVSENDDSYSNDSDDGTYFEKKLIMVQISGGDVENLNKAVVYEIIPVFRRDCHLQIYSGCHDFPREGYYLFKFSNAYSVWRSKTLYYRMYYVP